MTCLFAGCSAIGPDYKSATIDAPASWSQRHGGSPTLQAPTESAAALPADRWAVFDDPELTHLQSLALQANQDVKTAALRVLQSRVSQTTVSAQRGLQVNANGGISRQRQSEAGSNEHFIGAIGGGGGVGGGNQQQLLKALASPFTIYQAGFDASWEPDLWGRVLRAEEAAKATTEAQQAMLREVQLSVSAEVARAYFLLRATQRQKQLAMDQLAAAQEMQGLLKAQRDAGLSDDSSLIRQRSQVASLQALVPALLSEEARSMNQITLLCAAEPGALNEELSPSRIKSIAATLPDLKLGLPSELAHRRPDIAAAEAHLHAATANIGIARADLYPRITLGARFGFDAVDSSKFGEWGSREWSVGPSLSLPLFDQGRRHATINLREFQQQEAAVAYQRTVLKAWHEVDDAISAYAAETQRDAQMLERVKTGEEEAKLAQARYANGLTTYVPVLTATATLLVAQSDQAESTARVNTALAAIYKALGNDGDLSAASN